MFSYSRTERALDELRASNLKEKAYLEWVVRTYGPMQITGVSEPTLGQVLSYAHAAWRDAQAARGIAEEPLPIPPGLDE